MDNLKWHVCTQTWARGLTARPPIRLFICLFLLLLLLHLSVVSKRRTDKNSSPPPRHDGTRSRCFAAVAPAATGHLATPRERYLKSGLRAKPRLSPPIISPRIEIIKKLLVHAGGLLDPQRVEAQPGEAAALCFCFVCVMGGNRDGGRERRSDPGRIKLSEAVGGIREITSSPLSFFFRLSQLITFTALWTPS